jgi:hypothetical protein
MEAFRLPRRNVHLALATEVEQDPRFSLRRCIRGDVIQI